MIKLTFCLHRLPMLTRAEFQDYWRSHHAALAAAAREALAIRRYIQQHISPTHTVPGSISPLASGRRNISREASTQLDESYEGCTGRPQKCVTVLEKTNAQERRGAKRSGCTVAKEPMR